MTDIRTFRAQSMQQALQLVRTHLGPEAAVLHTRQLNRGMLGWLTGHTRVEVTASNDFRVPSRFASLAIANTSKRPNTGRLAELESEGADGELALQDQIHELRLMVERLVDETSDGTASDSERDAALVQLLSLDFPLDDAKHIIADLPRDVPGNRQDPQTIWQQLSEWMAGRITVGSPIQIKDQRPRVVALVGPTGVGKTTTIAKLAASHHFREHYRVGLINVDPYRMADVEPSKTFTPIVDLPVEVASSPIEMRAAMDKLGDLDLILIDTAGQSPIDKLRLNELKAMIHEANPHEIHLVLSVVAGASSLSCSLETFREVGITSLLLTKLDEAPTLGAVWSVLKTGLPVSYITNGQQVPDDIAPATAQNLCDKMLGQPFVEADV
jgi:flagellar biosynthesis protein FlhF